MSLRDSIASLANGEYTVTRTAAGSRVQGRYTPGSTSTFTIVALILPVTGRTLRDLPEGQRGDEIIEIVTVTELRSRTTTSDPDLVSYRGEPWTVTKVDRLDSFGEVHFECQAARAPDPRGAIP